MIDYKHFCNEILQYIMDNEGNQSPESVLNFIKGCLVTIEKIDGIIKPVKAIDVILENKAKLSAKERILRFLSDNYEDGYTDKELIECLSDISTKTISNNIAMLLKENKIIQVKEDNDVYYKIKNIR